MTLDPISALMLLVEFLILLAVVVGIAEALDRRYTRNLDGHRDALANRAGAATSPRTRAGGVPVPPRRRPAPGQRTDPYPLSRALPDHFTDEQSARRNARPLTSALGDITPSTREDASSWHD